MTELREWLDMFRKLKRPLSLTDEEINDVLVGVMDSTQCYFGLDVLRNNLPAEQYKALAEKFGEDKLTPDSQFGILKNRYDRYTIYKKDPKTNLRYGSNEEPTCENIFHNLNPEETSVEFLLAIVGETVTSKMDELEGSISNFGKLTILSALQDAVDTCTRSINLRNKTMLRLEHLGETGILKDVNAIFKVVNMLGTEFTPEEVQRITGKRKVAEGEEYRVVQRKSYQMRNTTGSESYPFNIGKGIPDEYVSQVLEALLRQYETNNIPPYINLSKDDARKLLSSAITSIEQFVCRRKKEERTEDFRKLNGNLDKIINEQQDHGSEALLDVLAMTECVFSDEDIKRLLPKEKYDAFDTEVSRRTSPITPTDTFRISKNEDGTFGIIRDSVSSGGQPFITFNANELDPKDTRKFSENVIEKQFQHRLRGIRGKNSRTLLQNTLSTLDRYYAMENTKEYVMSELGKLEEMSNEEARELIIAVMVMAQPVLVPDEEMKKEYKHLFSNQADYIITRNKEGKFFLKDTKGKAASVGLIVNEQTLSRNLPLYIDAMKRHKNDGKLHSTGYLSYDGVETVLDAAIAGFEKFKEREDKKLKTDVVAAVEPFARSSDVAKEKATVKGHVNSLVSNKEPILKLDKSEAEKI